MKMDIETAKGVVADLQAASEYISISTGGWHVVDGMFTARQLFAIAICAADMENGDA
jgi:hypothetical protein